MKKLFIVLISSAVSISFGAVVQNWSFDSGSLISDSGRHLGGAATAGSTTTLNDFNNNAANVGDTATLARGATGSSWIGPINNDATAVLYQDIVKLTLKLTAADFTGNIASHTDWSFRLHDSANSAWISLGLMDLFGNDRLVTALKTSGTGATGLITSGGLSGVSNRQVVNWTEAAGELALNTTEYESALTLDYGAGTWEVVTYNGDYTGTQAGTFNNEVITGFDKWQLSFANFDAADSVTLDNLTIEAIPEPATVGLLSMMGGGLFWMRRRFQG